MNTHPLFQRHELTLPNREVIAVQLFQLHKGERLLGLTTNLSVSFGVTTANIHLIALWLRNHPEVVSLAPIAITDPSGDRIIYPLDPPIIQVPAHAVEPRVGICLNGAIDLHIMAKSVEESGIIAVLGIWP